MVEVETNSLDYAQPDPAEAYKQAFAAFSGAAWVGESQYRQLPEVLAAAQLITSELGLGEGVITSNDAQELANDVTQICMAAGVSSSDMTALVNRAIASVGGSKATLDGIRSNLESEAKTMANSASSKAAESAEARRERLWGDIDRAEKDIEEEMRKKLARGEITQEQFDRWYNQYQHAETLQAEANADPTNMSKNRAASEAAVTAANAAVEVTGGNSETINNGRDRIVAASAGIDQDQGYGRTQSDEVANDGTALVPARRFDNVPANSDFSIFGAAETSDGQAITGTAAAMAESQVQTASLAVAESPALPTTTAETVTTLAATEAPPARIEMAFTDVAIAPTEGFTPNVIATGGPARAEPSMGGRI